MRERGDTRRRPADTAAVKLPERKEHIASETSVGGGSPCNTYIKQHCERFNNFGERPPRSSSLAATAVCVLLTLCKSKHGIKRFCQYGVSCLDGCVYRIYRHLPVIVLIWSCNKQTRMVTAKRTDVVLIVRRPPRYSYSMLETSPPRQYPSIDHISGTNCCVKMYQVTYKQEYNKKCFWAGA